MVIILSQFYATIHATFASRYIIKRVAFPHVDSGATVVQPPEKQWNSWEIWTLFRLHSAKNNVVWKQWKHRTGLCKTLE